MRKHMANHSDEAVHQKCHENVQQKSEEKLPQHSMQANDMPSGYITLLPFSESQS